MVVVFEKSNKNLAAEFKNSEILEVSIKQHSNGEFFTDPINVSDNQILILFPNSKNIHESFFQFLTIYEQFSNNKIINLYINYFPYSRNNTGLIFKNIFNIFKNLNINKIFTLDIHCDKNLKNIINILPHMVFEKSKIKKNTVIIAPDIGASRRSLKFAEKFNLDMLIINKNNNEISGDLKNIQNSNCLIIDDIIDSGFTIKNAVEILNKFSPQNISVLISHINKFSIISGVTITFLEHKLIANFLEQNI